MAKLTYTPEQIQQIIGEYKASGDAITVFCASRGHKPSYQTLKGWIAKADGVTTAGTKASPSSKTGLNLEAEFNEGYQQQRDQQYLAFLGTKRKEIAGQLAAVDQEIRNLNTKLGISNPIVEH